MPFSRSPKDFFSPARLQELTAKISHLELLLEMESQQKTEALRNVEALGERVKELQSEAERSREDPERREPSEQRNQGLEPRRPSGIRGQSRPSGPSGAELEAALKSGARHKDDDDDAATQAEFWELRATELERRLDQQSHLQAGADKQVDVALRDRAALGTSSLTFRPCLADENGVCRDGPAV